MFRPSAILVTATPSESSWVTSHSQVWANSEDNASISFGLKVFFFLWWLFLGVVGVVGLVAPPLRISFASHSASTSSVDSITTPDGKMTLIQTLQAGNSRA